eukprot:CAMPEP_0181329652 /NCGR_PEP_ID=MMETSP1101-20121128/23429_1 /TAXON_ID=46948 /ORGANISM="Rhodomonas abbreviata, Strain Caron Lab Isolate" /LENGTH=164 /DNA_ID=CAMNT_0023438753 /DNA_START=23 /DNA_END=514 /DNA_ORIENTATION=-
MEQFFSKAFEDSFSLLRIDTPDSKEESEIEDVKNGPTTTDQQGLASFLDELADPSHETVPFSPLLNNDFFHDSFNFFTNLGKHGNEADPSHRPEQEILPTEKIGTVRSCLKPPLRAYRNDCDEPQPPNRHRHVHFVDLKEEIARPSAADVTEELNRRNSKLLFR